MKKRFLFIVFILLAGLAMMNARAEACQLENVTITANCSGFTISGELLANWYYHEYANISYSFVVSNGTESIDVSGRVTVQRVPGEYEWFEMYSIPLAISDIWPKQFCGDVTVEGITVIWHNTDYDSILEDIVELEPVTFYCPCSIWCPRTPGYWKNHSESWPVSIMEIGGVSYTQAELIEFLKTPLSKDKNLILVKHLIAAKLNLLSGSSFSQDILDEADSYLMSGGFSKDYMTYLKDILDEFNNSGDCD
ncbi:MAG: hypothetical protein JW807_00585 [Spirochaetes bacterium]|nr:hypothetical protein [Spirochaetota bacterium]